MSSGQLCLVHLKGWSTWWHEMRSQHFYGYLSVFVFTLSTVLGRPIALGIFFLLRKCTPSKWE